MSSNIVISNVKGQFKVFLDDNQINNIESDLNPEDSALLFYKWQAYTAKQLHKHLITASTGRGMMPSKTCIQLLEEFSSSSDTLVQNILLSSVEILLRDFRSYSNIVSFAENTVHTIFKKTSNIKIVLNSIKLFQYFSSNIDNNKVSKNIEYALAKFPMHQGDILQTFEEIGGEQMVKNFHILLYY